MATITRVTTWSTGDTLTADALNGEFNNIVNDYNGGITNANISASAGIALSKLASTPATLTGTETLTNKTIDVARTIGNYENWVTDTDGATVTFDLDAGNKHRVTLAGNRTLALSNVQNGHAF